jgi:hypothetical protein
MAAVTSLSLAALPPKERERLLSGMRAPKPVQVAAGTTLYRFASSYDRFRNAPIPPARSATGPWWLDEQGFRLIQSERAASLKAHGNDPKRALTVGFLARQAAAVKQEWSNVDVLVTARVTTPFAAFSGKGRAQHEVPDRSTGFWNYNVRFVWTGWDRISQLYVPFLDAMKPGHLADGRKIFDIVSTTSIESQQLY